MWVVGLICLHSLLCQNVRFTDAATLNWSKNYSLKAILKIPSADIRIPYQAWVNGLTNRTRLDFYDGLSKFYRQWNELDQTYEYFKIYPDTSGKTDKEVCNKLPSDAAGTIMRVFNVYFPNRQWAYVQPEKINNIETLKYTYKNVYDYTVWVKSINESNEQTPVPVRFVSERKVGYITLEHYLHDYLYFDDKEPDVQTLLMPLCMQCNPWPNTTVHEPIDFVSKYVLTQSPYFEEQERSMDRDKRYRRNCYNTKERELKKATILNIQQNQEKNLRTSCFVTMRAVVVLVYLFRIFNSSDATGNTIQWSKTYSLKAVLTVPGANITEPYQVWFDGDTGKSRVDFYHGMDKLYREYNTTVKKYKYYKIYPVTNTHMESKEVCNEVDAEASQTKMYALNSYLPIKRWTYVGNERLNNAEAKKFVYEYLVKNYQKEIVKYIYSVWVNIKQGAAVPVRFLYEVKSETKVLDSFRHDYSHFDNSKPDASILEKPNMKCSPLTAESVRDPIDPLVEYIEPDLEYSRVEKAFDWFKTNHSKIYSNDDEHFKRINIFKDNLRFINSFNRQHRSFSVGVNQLADLAKEEIIVLFGTSNENAHIYETEGSGGDYDSDIDDDDEEKDMNNLTGVQAKFDWRDYGAVSPVKDQTPICSSCYAFTTAAAVESSAYVARGCQVMDEVSEQAIIDCSWGVGYSGNIGCSGGTYENTLKWALKHGFPLKSEYGPYLALEGRCHSMEMNKLVMINGYKKLDKQKRVIKDTLRNNGPLLASMDTNHFSFTFYDGGIYDDPDCSSNPANRSHGVVIVGYGRENGQDHWILKNSFGKEWGENGYMRLAQAHNRCGLKNDVFAVNFEKNKSFNCKHLK